MIEPQPQPSDQTVGAQPRKRDNGLGRGDEGDFNNVHSNFYILERSYFNLRGQSSRAPHLQFLKLFFVAFENGSLGNHNQGTTPDGRDVQVTSRADRVTSVNEEGVLWTTKLDGRQMLQAPYKCFPEVKADMVIRRPTCSLV